MKGNRGEWEERDGDEMHSIDKNIREEGRERESTGDTGFDLF